MKPNRSFLERDGERASVTSVIRADWVWTAVDDEPIADGMVIMSDGKIAAVGPFDESEVPGDAELIHRPGEFLMPGFIDAHTHITINPGKGNQIGQLHDPIEIQTMRGVGNLRAMLDSGVTTARIMGEERWLDVTFKEQIAKGNVPGPKLIVSTRPISQSNGHGRALSAFDGPDEIRKGSRENLYAGAEFLKMFITGGVSSTRGGGLLKASYSADEVRACVEEADRAGTYVAAHAIGGPGIRLAVEQGVRTIEHATLATDDDIALFEERKPWVVLTQSIMMHPTGIQQGDKDNPVIMEKLHAARAQAAERLTAIVASSSNITIGTDSMHGLFPFEMQMLVKWGMSPMNALKAGTIRAAECCRIEQQTGTLAPGKAADLVTLAGNPLDDFDAVSRARLIIKEGVRQHRLDVHE
jgi:imidazolonepropionase-like amidohydrolase